MKKSNKFLFWTPRIILIVFALFLITFSFDVFESAPGLNKILLAFFIHNLPSIILFILLLISWKHELFGGIIFTIFGVACVIGTIITLSQPSIQWFNPISIIGSIIFLAIGILFLISWKQKRR